VCKDITSFYKNVEFYIFSAKKIFHFSTMEDSREILLQLGETLKGIRKQKGLTQLDIEVKTGIDAGDLSRIESGQVNLSFTKLVKLAMALNVQLNEIYSIKKPK